MSIISALNEAQTQAESLQKAYERATYDNHELLIKFSGAENELKHTKVTVAVLDREVLELKRKLKFFATLATVLLLVAAGLTFKVVGLAWL